MLKTFPIEFMRQTLEQTLLQQHLKNVNFFGGKNQINLSSFYQQLKTQEDVDRFVETFRDLVDQQNRTNLIGNGILMSPENPTITNLYSCLIIPMTWTCSLRCKLENRDQMLETINNLIYELKGSKVDIAQLDCVDEQGRHYAQPFVVGTIGHNENAPMLKDGDYIRNGNTYANAQVTMTSLVNQGVVDKDKTYLLYTTLDSGKLGVIQVLYDGKGAELELQSSTIDDIEVVDDEVNVTCTLNFGGTFSEPLPVYSVVTDLTLRGSSLSPFKEYHNVSGVVDSGNVDGQGNLSYVVTFTVKTPNFTPLLCLLSNTKLNIVGMEYSVVEDDGTYPDFIFPPEHESFEKYKLSMSFDSLRCDTPNTLNAQEYCEISFGGSATLQNSNIRFGNDLVKVMISKYGFVAETSVTYVNPTKYWLEPLEMPSGNNANTKLNQLVSNRFINNTHTDALSINLQYTFVADHANTLLDHWFNYGRYGTQNIDSYYDTNTMTPNLIYNVIEYWSWWGYFEPKQYLGKLVESIDIENTEGDTMTLSITMQVQGENN